MFRKILFVLVGITLLSSSFTVWADQGTETRPVQRLGTGIPTSIAASPDGETLAVGSSIGVWFLDATSLAPIGFWDTYASVAAVNFSADGRYVKADLATFITRDWDSFAPRPYTAGKNLGMLIYDIQSGSVSAVNAGTVAWLKHECSSRYCAKVQLNQEKRIVGTFAHDNASNQNVQTFGYPTFDVSWSPDSAKAYAVIDAKVQVWDMNARLVLKESNLFTGELWSFVWSPDSSQIASQKTVWNTGDAQVARLRSCPAGYYAYRNFNCEWPSFIAFWASIKLYDLAKGTSTSFVPHHIQLYAADLSADKKLLVTTGNGIVQACRAYMPHGRACPTARATTRIWDATTLKLQAELPSIFYDVKFTPDSRYVVGNTRKAIEVWDWLLGQKIHSIALPSTDGKLAVSPVGGFVAIVSGDQLLLYRFDTGEYITTLLGHTASITWFAFSLSGKEVAASSLDGTILIWNLP